VVDLASGAVAFLLAGGCIVAALIMGTNPLFVLAVLALGVFGVARELVRVVGADPSPAPKGANLDSARRTAASTALRLAPGWFAICVLPTALAAWAWYPPILLIGAGALVSIGAEYFGALFGVLRWERTHDALVVQTWVKPHRGKRPSLHFVRRNETEPLALADSPAT
jgi:hypothetical protein